MSVLLIALWTIIGSCVFFSEYPNVYDFETESNKRKKNRHILLSGPFIWFFLLFFLIVEPF